MLSFSEALQALLTAAVPVVETRELSLEAAAGRVLSVSQLATVNVPPLDNSAMDGYAVRVAEVAEACTASLALPCLLYTSRCV